MASSTLLQKLDGGSDFGSTTSNRRQTEIFLAAETLVVGDAVSVDLSKTNDGDKGLYIVKADTGTPLDRCFVGVVLQSVEPDGTLTAESRIEVVTRGLVTANVAGTTVAGSQMVISAVAGQLLLKVPATNLYPVAAISSEADTANLAKVYVLSSF